MALDVEINNRLIRIYGRESLTNKPKYRVVRSETQTEKRYGSYDLLYKETNLWMGVRQGLVEIKKYWYMKDCWVLERVEPNINRTDIFYEKYTYEPILPFLDKDNNVLPLNWKAIEFLVNRIEKAARILKTEKDHQEEYDEAQLAEERKVYAFLDAPEPTKQLPTFSSSTLIPK